MIMLGWFACRWPTDKNGESTYNTNRGMDALFYDFLYGGWDKNVFRAASCGIGLLTQSKQKTGKDLSCCSIVKQK